MALCTIVAHNIAQNRPDNFPSYPPDNHHHSDDVYLREGGRGCNKVAAPQRVGGPTQSGEQWWDFSGVATYLTA